MKELNFITNKYLVEIERDKLLTSHFESLKEYKEGKLKFSFDFSELKKTLEEKWLRFLLVLNLLKYLAR